MMKRNLFPIVLILIALAMASCGKRHQTCSAYDRVNVPQEN